MRKSVIEEINNKETKEWKLEKYDYSFMVKKQKQKIVQKMTNHLENDLKIQQIYLNQYILTYK